MIKRWIESIKWQANPRKNPGKAYPLTENEYATLMKESSVVDSFHRVDE